MKVIGARWLGLIGALILLDGSFVLPPEASAKVFFYSMTEDGGLIKYDPDADQIVQINRGAGQGYINRRNIDADGFRPTRVLDIPRRRIVTFTNVEPGLVLLDVSANTGTKIAVTSPLTDVELEQILYPRQASKFYIHWVRRPSPSDPGEAYLTAMDLTGRILGTTPSLLAEDLGFSLPHPDGGSFYVLNQPNVLLRVDGETLSVRETHSLGAFYRPGATGHGIADVRDGRALLSEGEGTRNDLFDPRVMFTVDLATGTASPRIVAGVGSSSERLLPGGRTVLLQEARTKDNSAGSGRLHFYDVATGNKLGIVTFQADRGADILGFHPDGRRLFFRAWNLDPSTGELVTNLVIVDVVGRSVARDRPFEKIGVAVDFVDEP